MSSHDYTINRVKVHFPCKAYPSQVAMMNNIIKALQRGQHALLESPTGSGKSLALLCASLAWQREEISKAREYNMAVEQGLMEPEMELVGGGDVSDAANADLDADAAIRLAKFESLRDGGGGFINIDNDEDFVDYSNSPEKKKRKTVVDEDELLQRFVPPPVAINVAIEQKVKKKFAPKIFFGTRTHKQITQIIRELNKTAYKDCKMTILGSREHTCIHPTISKMKNKNEGCKELTDRKKGMGCTFQSNVKTKMSNHHAINSYKGDNNAWDLEDLVRVGKKLRACPYFGSRELMKQSQIIFCPYNYLIEPMIRKSLDINLKGQVVILDEAHNIEDASRSASSWQVTQDEVKEAMKDLERMGETDVEPGAHKALASLCSKLLLLIDACSGDLNDYNNFGSSSKVWNGTEILALFEVHGLGRQAIGEFQESMAAVMGTLNSEGRDREEEADVQTVHTNTVSILEGFFGVVNYLCMHDMKFRDDYRVAITRSQVRNTEDKSGTSQKPVYGMWLGKSVKNAVKAEPRESSTPKFRFMFTMNFWCLNPAVAFMELKDSLHSVVLTSGTLSPMASFSSELDVNFTLKLEANHVIDRKQVWISTISRGPNGHPLNATYRNAESFDFQDEIGRLTLGMCEQVTHGVLLFLPSYSMLNKLSERWRQTGLWDHLSKHKVVITEPRFSDEFESSIRHFYDVIETVGENASNDDGITGALFIAVCRGKVSEGLDFADNNARAVICVGIPFPNFKDIQVDLKKKYNDKRRGKEKDVLSGNDWYEIQAFRALNQALGRCIRHRKDWGAILMVDDRYQKNPRYISGLSKWVRSGVVHHSSFPQMMHSLNSFTKAMRLMDLQAEEIVPQTVSPPVPVKPTVESLPLKTMIQNKLAVYQADCTAVNEPVKKFNNVQNVKVNQPVKGFELKFSPVKKASDKLLEDWKDDSDIEILEEEIEKTAEEKEVSETENLDEEGRVVGKKSKVIKGKRVINLNPPVTFVLDSDDEDFV